MKTKYERGTRDTTRGPRGRLSHCLRPTLRADLPGRLQYGVVKVDTDKDNAGH
jgi:hypothetical protein